MTIKIVCVLDKIAYSLASRGQTKSVMYIPAKILYNFFLEVYFKPSNHILVF